MTKTTTPQSKILSKDEVMLGLSKLVRSRKTDTKDKVAASRLLLAYADEKHDEQIAERARIILSDICG